MAMVHDPIRVSTWLLVFHIALLLVVSCLGSPVAAQGLPQGPTPTIGRGAERSSECLPRATRMRAHCDPKEVIVRAEGDFNVVLDLAPMKPVYCAAVIDIEYTQLDTVVEVAGTISVADCAACAGEHEIRVRVRNESGSVETLRFVESWERHDDQPVSFAGQYSIGQNMEVLRAHAVQLRCTCLVSDEQDTR